MITALTIKEKNQKRKDYLANWRRNHPGYHALKMRILRAKRKESFQKIESVSRST